MRIKVSYKEGSNNEFQVYQVDESGDGTIIFQGQLGGGGFLNKENKENCKKIIEEMVGLWNNFID